MAVAAAAASAVVGSSAAAALAASAPVSESRLRTGVVAIAAAAGGISGFLLWQLTSGKAGDECTAVERAIDLLNEAHRKRPRRPEDVLDNLTSCNEVERWIVRLSNGAEYVSTALRLAARAQHLERNAIARSDFPEGKEGWLHWRTASKQRQEERLLAILRKAGLSKAVGARACRLLTKECQPKDDREMQTLEDATCLVFLEHELASFQTGKETQKLIDYLQKTWKKMSQAAQALALGFNYDSRTLGCLVEAIAVAEQLDRQESPMVAPRLPKACVALLRKSWKQVPEDDFGKEFFDRVYGEDESLRAVFAHPICQRPKNVWKVIQLMLDLLDVESVPHLERLVHAIAATSCCFGKLRLAHLAPIKRALVRTVTSHASSKQEKKAVNRAWEAFFFALAAVAGPHLMLEHKLEELSAATASSLPIPGGGAHAVIMAANGAALLEMSLNITALSLGGNSAPEEVLAKLHEARGWLIDCVRDDVNAYCGLVSSCYAWVRTDEVSAPATPGSSTAEETERRLWLRRAAEVPMRVAELAMGTAAACLQCKSFIKPSLKGDWIAGAKMLRAAAEISLKNVAVNLRDLGGSGKANDVEKRLAAIRDMEPPWEDLVDVMP
eukprot:TRINITY_DN23715_c0_g1_i1.p1 TRINITY_DN23715_c0_g1~~TRINITY_DN23715_c0_g1_i1.p1  ORF type:complete len:612 (+),score=124.49 TRINITY_DN23715_c0_g1_i1:61-1896(+)